MVWVLTEFAPRTTECYRSDSVSTAVSIEEPQGYVKRIVSKVATLEMQLPVSMGRQGGFGE
jgi:hypothetical protein